MKLETCSRSKRQKSHGGGGGEGKRVSTTEVVVGIGRLPDAMLCHILSFLRTKDAVQTSVLSKRWRYVWTAVPCIDIQYPRYESFPDFFDRFLRINIVSCLRKFHLSLTQDFDQLSEWISIVLKREIEEIVIHLWGSQSVKLPPSIFTCTKLVILRLSHANLLDVPPSVYLPSLKILEICLQKPFKEDSMTNLLDGCPVIEELDIQGDGDCNVKTLSFRSSSLKSLVINSSLNDVKIVVDIPNVERLDLVVLDYVNGQDCKQLSEWISFALKRDVEEIIAKLPPAPSNFTCKKIVSLKLGYGILLDVPSSVYLPSLKILHLYLGKLFVKDSMANLLDGCPVIEELCIHRMKDYNVKTLFFRSSSLKSLSIDASSLNDLRIVVDVPNVERLHLRDHGNAQYDINNLSSLVNVKIYIWQGLGLFELLRKFTYTEYMFISFQTMKRINYRHLDDFPMFHNLTHLVVDMYGPRRPVLPYLLECSPNLVIFDYSVTHKPSSREQHRQFKAPKCFLLYLEVIKLSGLRGFDDEMEMVRYFLKNAKVLKELSIQFGAGEKKKFEISKKVLKFSMSSPDCEIIFN